MINYNQAPILKAIGEKNRDEKWGKAIRTHHLESLIFRGLDGKCGAQIKIMLFLTGNANDGSFAVAEKTIIERCGISEITYKKARKSLVEKGWLIHNVGYNGKPGEIIVNYNAIYDSEKENSEDTLSLYHEDTSVLSEDTLNWYLDDTYNNIGENTIKQNNNHQSITNNPIGFSDDLGGFIF